MNSKVLASVLILMLIGGNTFAEDGKNENKADSIAVVKQLEEIKVYSQRRTENLHSVPVSATSLLPNKIEREGIVAIQEFASRIPNFYMPDYGNKVNSPIYIRGIGSKFNTPSVAFYVDYVPYFDKSTFDFELFDIGGVEVLRGPQGTLFGRNSMGGAVSIFTKEPTSTMSNRLFASYGNYDYMNFMANHSNTYGKLGVNVGVSYKKRDGFWKNEFDGSDVDYLNDFDAKINLSYKATPTFSIKVTGGVSVNNDGGNPYQVYDTTTFKFNKVNFDEKSYYTRDFAHGAVILSKKFGGSELRNVSAYQYFQDHQHLDQDYLAEDVYQANFYQYQHLVSNELVFLTPQDKVWSSQTGFFFFNQLMDKGIGMKNGKDAGKYASSPMSRNFPGATNLTRTSENDYGFALFHQSQLKLKNWTLALGFRLDYEEKYYEYVNTTKVPVMPKPIVSSKSIPWDKFVCLPKATLAYNIGDHNIYGSWGIGYKSGGFNTSFDTSRPSTITYDPEFAENFELGVKTRWFGNKLNVDASVFYTDWKKQQINKFLPNGDGLMILNAGHSFTKGVEVEASAVPVANLQLYASYGYVLAKFLDYNMGNNVVYDGNYLPFVPRSTFNGGVSYRVLIGSAHTSSINFGVDYVRTGKMYYNDANEFALFPGAKAYRDAVFNLNAFVGATWNDFELVLRGKNLTNEGNNAYVFEYEVDKFQYLYAQQTKPRQLFVELNYRF